MKSICFLNNYMSTNMNSDWFTNLIIDWARFRKWLFEYKIQRSLRNIFWYFCTSKLHSLPGIFLFLITHKEIKDSAIFLDSTKDEKMDILKWSLGDNWVLYTSVINWVKNAIWGSLPSISAFNASIGLNFKYGSLKNLYLIFYWLKKH